MCLRISTHQASSERRTAEPLQRREPRHHHPDKQLVRRGLQNTKIPQDVKTRCPSVRQRGTCKSVTFTIPSQSPGQPSSRAILLGMVQMKSSSCRLTGQSVQLSDFQGCNSVATLTSWLSSRTMAVWLPVNGLAISQPPYPRCAKIW